MIPPPPRSTLFPYTTLFRLRENSLSLVMFSLFGLCLLGHSLAGYATYHDDQQAHRQLPMHYTAYVTDRKSTRLNSSHVEISYAVFCLKKKKKKVQHKQ